MSSLSSTYSTTEYKCLGCQNWFTRDELKESYYNCESCGEHSTYICRVCPHNVIVIDCVFDYMNITRERIVRVNSEENV